MEWEDRLGARTSLENSLRQCHEEGVSGTGRPYDKKDLRENASG